MLVQVPSQPSNIPNLFNQVNVTRTQCISVLLGHAVDCKIKFNEIGLLSEDFESGWKPLQICHYSKELIPNLHDAEIMISIMVDVMVSLCIDHIIVATCACMSSNKTCFGWTGYCRLCARETDYNGT